MNRLIPAASIALLAFAGGPAAAQDPVLARTLVATCANCHGTDGHAIAGAGMPVIAGQSRESVVQKMREFRSGTRPATVMHQIAKGYTDEQIDLVADYLAKQK